MALSYFPEMYLAPGHKKVPHPCSKMTLVRYDECDGSRCQRGMESGGGCGELAGGGKRGGVGRLRHDGVGAGVEGATPAPRPDVLR